MSGAPPSPNRPVFSHAPRTRRHPGIGDHVCMCGGYLGLIVAIDRDGMCTVAKRSRNGRATVETRGIPAGTLQVSPITPIMATETRDPGWRRGVLG